MKIARLSSFNRSPGAKNIVYVLRAHPAELICLNINGIHHDYDYSSFFIFHGAGDNQHEMSSRIFLVLSLFALTLICAPSIARAACTSPDGGPGSITWNGVDAVIWCDGTTWHSLADSGGGLTGGTSGYLGIWSGATAMGLSSTTAGQQLYWDGTNHRLGIGTTSPAAKLDIDGTIRLAKNSSQPAACNSSNDASIALTAAYTTCVCKNGTGWVATANGSTACLWALTPVNLTISANTQNYSVFTAAGSPSSPVAVTLTISSGVTVGSSSTAAAALTTDAFPSGSTITIINDGTIVGKGGVGGEGYYGNGLAGSPGGPAFQALHAVNITNNGTIAGGGGGGGGGNGATSAGYQWAGGGGGGGAGNAVGAGGAAGSGSCYGSCASAGNNGTGTNGGSGGGGGASWGGAGGTGGALGNAGASAASGPNGGVVGTPGSGGAAGPAVIGNAYITWNVQGTRLGPIN